MQKSSGKKQNIVSYSKLRQYFWRKDEGTNIHNQTHERNFQKDEISEDLVNWISFYVLL